MSTLPPVPNIEKNPERPLPPPSFASPGNKIKKKGKKTIWIILGGILGLLIFCGILSSIISPDDNHNANEQGALPTEAVRNDTDAENKITETPKPTKTTKPPTPTQNPNLIKPGMYLIGSELKPGTYKGIGNGCYWERLKDASGSLGSIIANGNSDGQYYVQVREGDFAFSTTCEMLLLEPNPTTAVTFPNSFDSGTYLVNIDIKPGLYKGNEEGCYWERLKDLFGGFEGILANDNSTGQFYIRVKDSDKALSVSCSISLVESITEHSGEFPQKIDPGVYIIGYDIQPGIYKGETEGCYWERLNDVTGGFDSIISNDNSRGLFYVQVYSGDFALSTDCSLTRTGN